jgi:hypothetical protein
MADSPVIECLKVLATWTVWFIEQVIMCKCTAPQPSQSSFCAIGIGILLSTPHHGFSPFGEASLRSVRGLTPFGGVSKEYHFVLVGRSCQVRKLEVKRTVFYLICLSFARCGRWCTARA